MLICKFRGERNLFCVKTKGGWSLQRISFLNFFVLFYTDTVLLPSLEKGKPITML